jgi:DNA mismatch repair protein MutL
MPFYNVDVNVHPQKATVRFSDARSVCSACYHAVKNALEQYEQTQYLSFAGGNARIANEDIVGEQSKTKTENEHKDGIAERLAKAYKYLPENPIFSDNKSDRLSDRFSQPTINSISIPKTISSPPLPIKDITEPQKIDSGTDYKIIGQLFKTYILIENGEELILIDQHAAHERILFDKMLADFERDTPSQLLMMPYIYECSYDDVSYLKEIIPKLQKIGFDIDDFGDNHFKVNAIPLSIGNMDIHAFLDSVIRDKYSGKNEVLKEYLAKKCCKAAIKGGDELDNQIIEYVMDYFIKNSLPLHCPHGRPTLIKFKKREIETLFGRIK